MQKIRGYLTAFERLNASSTEYASANWGEIDAKGDLKEQLEKWLSSSARVAEITSVETVANHASKVLKAALIPWMFYFAGVNRGKNGAIDYSGNVLTTERTGRVALDPQDYFESQADVLVEMLLEVTKPEDVLRLEWKLTYRRQEGEEPASMDPYMADHWSAFVFKNSTKVHFLALTSILN